MMEDKFTRTPMVRHRTKGSTSRWILLFLIVAAGAGGFFMWRSGQASGDTSGGGPGGRGPGGPGGRGGRGGLGGAVPVVVAVAQKEDFPVYEEGLGAVTAFNTVTLKSRVDGQLAEVDFQEGQDVKKGDQLAMIDPRPYQAALDQAQGALARDQAQLGDAKANDARYKEMALQGVIPQQQADTQHALVAQLTGAIASDQANIDTAKLNVTYSHITSPIDGRIGLRLVDVGNIVHASDPTGLLVITQMEPIAVIFTLPEDSLPAVVKQMSQGTLQVKAFSRDDSTMLDSGTLLTIDNEIDQTTGTYKLKAVFENKDRQLWPNQFVNARLLLNTEKNAIVVPAAAIQRGAQGTFVYRVKPGNTVEAEPVMIATNQGTDSSIRTGLDAGDQVVTEGQDRLKEGMQVDPHATANSLDLSSPGGGGGRGGPGGFQGQGGPGGPGGPGGRGRGRGDGSNAYQGKQQPGGVDSPGGQAQRQ
jgi:multidrug efflux system membrane fusion protein